MMFKTSFRKSFTITIASIITLLLISTSASAFEPHENPETAVPVYNGISLLRYYSTSLDFILQKQIPGIENRLWKMPFVNIPEDLEETTQDFITSSIDICYLVVDIDERIITFQSLIGEFRLEEAAEQASIISSNLSITSGELKHLEEAVEVTAYELEVFSAPEDSELKNSYNELLDRIERVREMLSYYQEILETTGTTPEEIINIQADSTELTLNVQPAVAFVGDNISFEGILTSEGKPLSGRKINILLDSSRYITTITDSRGHYQGILQVPYRYTPEMKLQALYYPQNTDVGKYLASLSPVIDLSVLYYEAALNISSDKKAYPGLPTTIEGNFIYNQSVTHEKRYVEIYLDNTLVTEVYTSEEFILEIDIAPDTATGKHIITASAVSSGRYSPVAASAVLNIIRATPILDMGLPGVAMIPGKFELDGKLYSEIGPVEGASVNLKLGNSDIELTSSNDGSFNTEMGMKMNFGLIGSQELEIQVFPQEPWHAPLFTTRNVLTVNFINCGGILIVVVLLGIYLPPRIQKRLGVYIRKRTSPTEPEMKPETEVSYSRNVLNPVATTGTDEIHGEPKDVILFWYRIVIRLIQGITEIFMKPHHTLREFAGESSKILGPAARYFSEITGIVERTLYSKNIPTEDDARQSEHMSNTIKYFTELNDIETGLHYSQNEESKDNTGNERHSSLDNEKDV